MSTVVTEGVSGLLYEPRDPADLCRAVREIIARPEREAAMQLAARRRYEELYQPARNLEMLLTIYAEALTETRRDGKAAGSDEDSSQPTARPLLRHSDRD